MIWKGPGVLKFGTSEGKRYVYPDTKLSDDMIAGLKKSGILESLLKEGKVVELKVSKPKDTVVKKVKKK